MSFPASFCVVTSHRFTVLLLLPEASSWPSRAECDTAHYTRTLGELHYQLLGSYIPQAHSTVMGYGEPTAIGAECDTRYVT